MNLVEMLLNSIYTFKLGLLDYGVFVSNFSFSRFLRFSEVGGIVFIRFAVSEYLVWFSELWF